MTFAHKQEHKRGKATGRCAVCGKPWVCPKGLVHRRIEFAMADLPYRPPEP